MPQGVGGAAPAAHTGGGRCAHHRTPARHLWGPWDASQSNGPSATTHTWAGWPLNMPPAPDFWGAPPPPPRQGRKYGVTHMRPPTQTRGLYSRRQPSGRSGFSVSPAPCNGKPRNTRAHQRPPRAPRARFATGRPDRPLQRRGPLKWPCAANARMRSQIPDWHWQPGEEHPKTPGSRTTWSWGIAHTQKIYFKRMISSMHLGPPPVCTQGARRVGTASGLGRHLCIVHTQT